MIPHVRTRLHVLEILKQQQRRLAHVQTLLNTQEAELQQLRLSHPRCQQAILKELLVFLVRFGTLPQGAEHRLFCLWCTRLAQTMPLGAPGTPVLKSGDPLVEEVITDVVRLLS